MGNNNPPGIRLTGIRASIPPGYILGRVSAGIGGVELISVGKAQATGLIPTTLPPSGPAGGDLSGTYPNPTVAKINTQTLPAPASVAHQVLMYSGSALAWTNQHLDGGTSGQVATKNSGTDFDISWATPHYLIAGGNTGQVLAKNSNADYDVHWVDQSSGGGGASSFFLDGAHGYVAEVDSNGLLVLDSMGRGVYSVDPVIPAAMIPVDGFSIAAAGLLGTKFCGFFATLNTAQSVTDNVFTTVKYDTTSLDTLSGYSPSTGIYTPTKSGKWLFFWGMRGSVLTTMTLTQGKLIKGSTNLQLVNAGQLAPTFSNLSASIFAFALTTMNGTTDSVHVDGIIQGSGGSDQFDGGNTLNVFGGIFLGA